MTILLLPLLLLLLLLLLLSIITSIIIVITVITTIIMITPTTTTATIIIIIIIIIIATIVITITITTIVIIITISKSNISDQPTSLPQLDIVWMFLAWPRLESVRSGSAVPWYGHHVAWNERFQGEALVGSDLASALGRVRGQMHLSALCAVMCLGSQVLRCTRDSQHS